jgi:hypothetical protein
VAVHSQQQLRQGLWRVLRVMPFQAGWPFNKYVLIV